MLLLEISGKYDSHVEADEVPPNEIPVAFLRVELGGETADVADSVGAPPGSLDGGKANKGGCGPAGVGQNARRGVFGSSVVRDTEVAVSTSTASMNDTLGNTLVVESLDFLQGDLVYRYVEQMISFIKCSTYLPAVQGRYHQQTWL